MKNTVTGKIARRQIYSAPALEKGLDILELLADKNEGLTIKEIAQCLDKSVNELFRMLVVLQQRDYVELGGGSERYVLTLKLFGLAHHLAPVKRLTGVAGPIMRRLVYQTEQSCHLVVYDEGKCHVIAQEDSPSDRTISVRLGAEAPLLGSCSGHVLLAFSDDDAREAMLANVRTTVSKKERQRRASLFTRIQRKGFESKKSSQVQGVRDVGYPVFDHAGTVVAALVMPFLSYLDGSHDVDFESARDYVAAAADEISSSLGYQQA